jgi:hypothetical protein
MARDAVFPDVPFDKQAELSLIAADVAKLLAKADALHGVTDPNVRSAADVIVAMREPKRLERAQKAAELAARQVVRGACQRVEHEWEEHSEIWFLQDRLSDVKTYAAKVSEATLLTFWTCLREPFRFCACGHPLPCRLHKVIGGGQ